MKKYFKILLITCIVIFTSCEDFEPVVYDEVNGQTGVGFTTGTTSVVIPEEGITVSVSVQSTKKTSAARSFNVSVDEALSTGSSADYNIGSITIPANSYDGTLEVTFGNFDNLLDLTTFKLVLILDLPSDAAVVGSETTTFNYLKKLICNDFVLTLNEDFYSDERSWEILDDSGNVVVSGGPYPQTSGGSQIIETFTLADGCYTFTIYDAFGDGQYDGAITGGYSLDCSIINFASGTGNWGSEDTWDFCVNL